MTKKKLSPSGFTLIEVILSLALGGIILSTIMTLFITFIQVWQEDAERKNFFDHIDNCVHFLDSQLNSKNPWIDMRGLSGQILGAERIKSSEVGIGNNFGLSKCFAAPLLCLDSEHHDPCVITLTYASPKLMLWMEGLTWKRKRIGTGIEEKQEAVISRCLVSDLITKVECLYLDHERGTWTTMDWKDALRKSYENKDKALGKLPDALWLTFTKDKLEEKRFISLLGTKNLQNSKPTAKEKSDQKRKKTKDSKEQTADKALSLTQQNKPNGKK